MQSIFEQLGRTYSEKNGYQIPNLILPAEKKEQEIGLWGQQHLRLVKQMAKKQNPCLLFLFAVSRTLFCISQ